MSYVEGFDANTTNIKFDKNRTNLNSLNVQEIVKEVNIKSDKHNNDI